MEDGRRWLGDGREYPLPTPSVYVIDQLEMSAYLRPLVSKTMTLGSDEIHDIVSDS